VEDLDAARTVPGSADAILRTLERFGLQWDDAVLYQSQRTALYADAVAALDALGLTFPCSCSRRDLADADIEGYPGTCRSAPSRPGPAAIRFRIDETRSVRFPDRIQGEVCKALAELGDVIIRRRDGVYAYQLAVVVDDASSGVTDVVRGADLTASTVWQIELQRALGLPQPRYAHVPLLTEADGSKLAKSRRSIAISGENPGPELAPVLALLGLEPPRELLGAAPTDLLQWACARWTLTALPGRPTLAVPG
jgi:glutamyl-Q tRNA(Asp) synthetase